MADKNMAEKYEALRAAIAQHKGEPGALMPVLQAAQNIFGYVPEDVQKLIAEGLGCTPVSYTHLRHGGYEGQKRLTLQAECLIIMKSGTRGAENR